MKRLTALVLALLLTLSLVACGGTAAEAPAPEATPDAPAADAPAAEATAKGIYGSADETYMFNVFLTGVEYWWPVYASFKETGKMLGVNTVYGGTPEYDATLQVESFDAMLAQKPTAIVTQPINPEPFVEPINRAVANGTEVVCICLDAPTTDRAGFVTSDNTNEGTQAAHALAAAIGGKGSVATCVNPGQTNHDVRTNTFKAVIESEYPTIKFAGEVVANQDMDAAQLGITTLAQQNPDLAAVFCPEATSAQGAAAAVKALGIDCKVMCCDVNEAILDSIKAGEFYGAINPNQGAQGYWAMMVAFSACHPELFSFMSYREGAGLNPINVPKLDNGLDVVTAENADSYYMGNFCAQNGYADVDDLLSAYYVE